MADRTIADLQQTLERGDQLNKQEAELLSLYIKQNEERKKSIDYLNEELKKLEEQQKFVNALSDEQGRIIEKRKIENEIETKNLEIKRNKLLEDAKGRELREDEIKDLITIEKKLDGIREKNKEIARAEGQGKVLANLLGIDEANKNSLTYQLFSNPAEVFDGFKGEIQKAGGVFQSVFLSTAMKIQEATAQAFYQYDQASVSVARLAGNNEKLLSVLSDTSRGATAYGISFEQAGRAIEGLYTNLNTFSNLNSSVQQKLTISAAKLDRLGISSQDSAKQIGTLSQIMRMSEVQAAKTSEKLAGFALAIGKSPQQISQDFAGASNSLAAYGGNMVNVFKDLEVQSKATGVAVGDLISIAEKFQTFEGAAQAAGRLNAALGGGFINSMELLEASAENPAAAIDLLRTRLNEAGMAFDEMSFYEKKMIADAAGFKTVEEASRVLSRSNAEAERAAKAASERANQQKLIDEAVERSIPIQQKLELLMANFAVTVGPLVDFFTGFLSGVLKLIDALGPFKYVLGIVVGIFVALLATSKVVAFFQAAAASIGSLFGALSASAPAAAAGGAAIEGIGTASAAAAPGVAAFGAALFEVAAGVALAAAGLGIMYAGIGYMIKGLVELFSVLANTDSIADSLLTLSLAMGAVGTIFTNPVVMAGLLVFSLALSDIVETLNKLDEKKSFNFATITKSVAELNVNTTTSPNNVMKQTGDLIKAINDFKLNSDASSNLERILKAAIPQQQATNVKMSPTFIVKIGDKVIRDIFVEEQTKVTGDVYSGTPVVQQ